MSAQWIIADDNPVAKRNISKEPNSVIGRSNEFLFQLESENLRVLNYITFSKIRWPLENG